MEDFWSPPTRGIPEGQPKQAGRGAHTGLGAAVEDFSSGLPRPGEYLKGSQNRQAGAHTTGLGGAVEDFWSPPTRGSLASASISRRAASMAGSIACTLGRLPEAGRLSGGSKNCSALSPLPFAFLPSPPPSLRTRRTGFTPDI